jgi:16S rRNA (cytosine967-C5)-methyltransferase
MDRLRAVPWRALAAQLRELEPALQSVLSGRPAERVLDAYLRAHRAFTPEERTAAAEAIFGVGLWRRRLYVQAGADASPRQLVLALVRDVAGVGDAVDTSELPAPRPPPASLAEFFSLPDWLSDTLVRELGGEAPALCDAISRPGPICLRANALKISRAELLEELAREGIAADPGAHAPYAVVLRARANLLGTAAQQEGRFEAQDEGSQLLAELVGAKPGERILDLCAGAGGKTLALAASLQNRGALYAYDEDAQRLDRLRQRASRAGVSGLRVFQPGGLPEALEVDRVLVDAPCSELGALRRGPDLRFRIDPASFPALQTLQAQLLRRAARHVAPGGRLVYATCTLRGEENEHVAQAFLAEDPGFRLIAPPCAPTFVEGGFFRSLPHRHGTDGFFAAVMERR